jgi:nitrogen PTS system EIIA component
MPHELMDIQQVARYLHVTVPEVQKFVAKSDLPAHKAGGQLQFRKGDVDHWVERRMHDLPSHRLAQIEKGVSLHHGLDERAPLLGPLIPPGGIAVPLHAKTRDAAIRALVQAAEAAGLVYDKNDLTEKIRQREELYPTTVAPGVAMPHPRHPLPYDIAASFVIVGRTPGGIPFGATDGTLTSLFFLICCKDDRTHLHVLARISRILDEETIQELVDAADAKSVEQILSRREAVVVATTD